MAETVKRTGKEVNLTSWKKGQSGNKNGRPKGQRSYVTIYREALMKIAASQDMTFEEMEDLLLQSGLKNALKGDYRFYQDCLDRLHGKPKQSPEDLGSPDNPINLVHKVVWE